MNKLIILSFLIFFSASAFAHIETTFICSAHIFDIPNNGEERNLYSKPFVVKTNDLYNNVTILESKNFKLNLDSHQGSVTAHIRPKNAKFFDLYSTAELFDSKVYVQFKGDELLARIDCYNKTDF